ncbi:MAG: ADP-ribosylglycohydrolase family protein [Planctomycetota bacterium]
MRLNRRTLLLGTALSLASARLAGAATTASKSRLEGMLIGSMIGDALGGPIEFLPPDRVRGILPGTRRWSAKKTINASVLDELAGSLEMQPYRTLRPKTAAYGPWKARSPRGTVTDDSRHKIVVIRALKAVLNDGRCELLPEDLARAIVDFQPHPTRAPDGELQALVDEGMREYRLAANWILGERDPEIALPIERLWSGISNCSGQMFLLPLAGLYAGESEQAYRATYLVDFVDAPIARDIVSSMNAGLAAVLAPAANDQSVGDRWELLFRTIRETDPLRLREVPFAGRPLDRWLDLADSIVERADGRPAKVFELLETEGKPIYWWDAHFTLLVPLTILKLCAFNPLAAMHLTLDFGHDTDSYAQVLGALAGAVHGKDIFPESMASAVTQRLSADFDESIENWVETLDQAAGNR